MFSTEELDIIARLCVEHDVIAVTDEVYEHLVFDGNTHVPLATRPGMADRTVTISSGGKTLSFTGWKIGWVCARPELVRAVQAAKQLLTYVSGGPFQPAVAVGLRLGDEFFDRSRGRSSGPTGPAVRGPGRGGVRAGRAPGHLLHHRRHPSLSAPATACVFCRSLPELCGVVAVPVQVLCDDKELGAPFVRFAACKRPEVLQEAVERLAALAKR